MGTVIGGLFVRLAGYAIEKRIERRQASPTPEEAEKELQRLQKRLAYYSNLAQNSNELVLNALIYNATISLSLYRTARFCFVALGVVAVVSILIIAILAEAIWISNLAVGVMILFLIAGFPLLQIQDNMPSLKHIVEDIHAIQDLESYKDRNLLEQKKMRKLVGEDYKEDTSPSSTKTE